MRCCSKKEHTAAFCYILNGQIEVGRTLAGKNEAAFNLIIDRPTVDNVRYLKLKELQVVRTL